MTIDALQLIRNLFLEITRRWGNYSAKNLGLLAGAENWAIKASPYLNRKHLHDV
jgi:hypothetical protein